MFQITFFLLYQVRKTTHVSISHQEISLKTHTKRHRSKCQVSHQITYKSQHVSLNLKVQPVEVMTILWRH